MRSHVVKYASIVALVAQTVGAVMLMGYVRRVAATPQHLLVLAAEGLKVCFSLLGIWATLPRAALCTSPENNIDISTVIETDLKGGASGGGASKASIKIRRKNDIKERHKIVRYVQHLYTQNVAWGHGNLAYWSRASIPGILYLIQNNLLYISLQHLSPPMYSILYQFKIVTTAVLSVWVLGRRFSRAQWGALGLLMAGVSLAQAGALRAAWRGAAAVLLACLTSGCAAIAVEALLKEPPTERDTSLWMVNLKLSVVGVVLGAAHAGWAKSGLPAMTTHAALLTAACVLCNAIGGILIALVLRYSDNIVKCYTNSISILLTTACSVWLYGTRITPYFVVGTLIVITSTFIYSYWPYVESKRASWDASPDASEDTVDDLQIKV